MGVAVFVSLERAVDGFDPGGVDGKALAASIEELDAACERLGVPTLSSFVSADPADLEGLTADTDPMSAGETQQPVDQLRSLGGTADELADFTKLAELAAEGAGAAPAPEQWFDASAGLPSVQALIAWLEQPATKFKADRFGAEDVLADLRAVAEVLTVAAGEQVCFHLTYDF
jgi:hypothetical protein